MTMASNCLIENWLFLFARKLCGCVFFSDILLIYSAVYLPVCLINLLTYLLVDGTITCNEIAGMWILTTMAVTVATEP